MATPLVWEKPNNQKKRGLQPETWTHTEHVTLRQPISSSGGQSHDIRGSLIAALQQIVEWKQASPPQFMSFLTLVVVMMLWVLR